MKPCRFNSPALLLVQDDEALNEKGAIKRGLFAITGKQTKSHSFYSETQASAFSACLTELGLCTPNQS